jgi:hypothetical protein
MTAAAAELAISSKLKATAAVTAYVSQRVYTRIAKEGETKPYIVITHPAGERREHTANSRSKFRKTPLSIRCVATTYLEAAQIADAVVDAIDSASTAVTGSQTWGGVSVDHCVVLDNYDASDQPQLGDEIGFPVEAVELDLFHIC